MPRNWDTLAKVGEISPFFRLQKKVLKRHQGILWKTLAPTIGPEVGVNAPRTWQYFAMCLWPRHWTKPRGRDSSWFSTLAGSKIAILHIFMLMLWNHEIWLYHFFWPILAYIFLFSPLWFLLLFVHGQILPFLHKDFEHSLYPLVI